MGKGNAGLNVAGVQKYVPPISLLQHKAPPLKSLNSHTFLRESVRLRESIFPVEFR